MLDAKEEMSEEGCERRSVRQNAGEGRSVGLLRAKQERPGSLIRGRTLGVQSQGSVGKAVIS